MFSCPFLVAALRTLFISSPHRYRLKVKTLTTIIVCDRLQYHFFRRSLLKRSSTNYFASAFCPVFQEFCIFHCNMDSSDSLPASFPQLLKPKNWYLVLFYYVSVVCSELYLALRKLLFYNRMSQKLLGAIKHHCTAVYKSIFQNGLHHTSKLNHEHFTSNNFGIHLQNSKNFSCRNKTKPVRDHR